MSIHTFTRDGAAAASYSADAPVIVLGHGGGSAYWPRTHPLAQWALQLAPIVHSLQLPFHGSDAVREMALPFSTDDERRHAVQVTMVQRLQGLLEPVLRGRYVIFVAYSTSAICLLKFFRVLRTRASIHPQSMLLCIGSALRIGATQPFIQQFWQTETFESNPGKRASMQRLHARTPAPGQAAPTKSVDDASWRNCVHMIRFATGRADSGLFTTPEEWKQLFSAPLLTFAQRQAAQSGRSSSSASTSASPCPASGSGSSASVRPCASLEANYVFFVQGSNDEPFPPDECLLAPLRSVPGAHHPAHQRDLVAERVRLVPTASHFGYFVPAEKGGSLEGVVASLDGLVQLYGQHDLLQTWRAQQGSRPAPPPAPAAVHVPATAHAAENARPASYASPPCYAGELQHMAQSRL